MEEEKINSTSSGEQSTLNEQVEDTQQGGRHLHQANQPNEPLHLPTTASPSEETPTPTASPSEETPTPLQPESEEPNEEPVGTTETDEEPKDEEGDPNGEAVNEPEPEPERDGEQEEGSPI